MQKIGRKAITSTFMYHFLGNKNDYFFNCEGFHLFCKIARFFATEPRLLIIKLSEDIIINIKMSTCACSVPL